jgi:hypothetical protein
MFHPRVYRSTRRRVTMPLSAGRSRFFDRYYPPVDLGAKQIA